MGWLYVPESVAWRWESASPWETPTAPSVMWRGKPMQPRSWRRAWERHSWLRLLSGTTLSPSTADAGVDAWISSQRATRASRSLMQESGLASVTTATSGPTSSASGKSAEQLGFFARTSPAILRSDSMRSAATFRAWGRELRQAYSARLKSAPRTAESGCSFSHRWPTATSTDTLESPRKGIVGNHNLSLPVAASRHGRQALRPTGAECPPNSGPLWSTPRFGPHGSPGEGKRHGGQPKGKRLNPLFVEWLMGWPLGWTDFAPVATEWSRWSQLMRYELSRLNSERT